MVLARTWEIDQLLLLCRARAWLQRNCFLPDHELQEFGNIQTVGMALDVSSALGLSDSAQAFSKESK